MTESDAATRCLVVVMGAAGSGKSTVAAHLADVLDVDFLEGDNAHTVDARARMARGESLDDEARGPWLDRLHEQLRMHADHGAVLACSALKVAYRRRLADGLDDVVFVALVAPASVLEARLAARRGHFAGPELVPSQLMDLELGDEVIEIDATHPVDRVVALAARAVRERPS
jgi:gluconokinase